ncbi:MAG: hypothetical protein R2939_10750 [Kofleriaceae bacterium]
MFAHFERAGGGQFRADHAPARPLSWWRAGQFIRYAIDVVVPRGTPPGRYVLRAGLWRGDRRRPARGPVPIVDDRAEVGAVEVVR